MPICIQGGQMETSDESVVQQVLPQGANIIQDIFGKKAAAIIDPIGRKAINAESDRKKELAAQTAATSERRRLQEVDIISQINKAAPAQVAQQQTVIDDRARARRRTAGTGKQSTILAGTTTRLKQRLGE